MIIDDRHDRRLGKGALDAPSGSAATSAENGNAAPQAGSSSTAVLDDVRNHSRASRRQLPRRHGVVAFVVVTGLLITAAVSWTSWSLNNRNETRLLELQTHQAADVLTAALPSTSTPLATAMQIVAASNGSVAQFSSYMSSFVGAKGQFVSASLWRRTGSMISRIAVVGVPPTFSTPTETRSLVARAFHSPTFIVNELVNGSLARLGYAYALPATEFAIYAEHPIPADRRAAISKDSAFSELRYAIYLGTSEQSPRLLTTSFSKLPPTGRIAKVTVPWGNTVLTLVTAPNESLDGSLPARLPWILGIAGALISIAAALIAERLVRRRRSAEQDATEIRDLYEELGSVFEEQRTIAETLQRSLLPKQTPDIPGIQVAVRYVPGAKGMEIGGDWYSAIALSEGRFAFVVGDVSGHGLDAASAMAALRFTIRTYALEGYSPSTILEKCSRHLNLVDDEHFATVLVGVGDVDRHEITFANAGHLNPLVIDSEGSRFVETKVGVPLGVSGGIYESITVDLRRGSTVIAFTDGLVERRDESLDVGLKRLQNAIRGDSQPLEGLLSKVISELTDDRTEDDIAMLGLRWEK
jgi:serine phosphatase RsbU (regulator of sigma subunit)